MADESTEIFDDLYLGLRAGGALRKQRRGEPLTTEEQEALGRWAAALVVAQGGRDRRLLGRDLRPRLHARRPDLRPLAQSLGSAARFLAANSTAGTSSSAGSLSRTITSTSVDEHRGERHRQQHVEAAEEQARSRSPRRARAAARGRRRGRARAGSRRSPRAPHDQHGDAGASATCHDRSGRRRPRAHRRSSGPITGHDLDDPGERSPSRSQNGRPIDPEGEREHRRDEPISSSCPRTNAPSLASISSQVSRTTRRCSRATSEETKPIALSRSKIQYAAVAKTKKIPTSTSKALVPTVTAVWTSAARRGQLLQPVLRGRRGTGA